MIWVSMYLQYATFALGGLRLVQFIFQQNVQGFMLRKEFVYH